MDRIIRLPALWMCDANAHVSSMLGTAAARAGTRGYLTVFRKARSAEVAEVARALQAQKTWEAEHGPAHGNLDRLESLT
jgi:hypothetical protein